MVIEKILKQLTPEKIKKEVQEIQEIELPFELQGWVKEYEKVGERNKFTWKWIFKVPEITTFSSVPKKFLIPAQNVKFLVSMFFILVDDVADKTKNIKLLDELIKISFSHDGDKLSSFSKEEKKYLNLARELWKQINKIIKKAPRYKEFIDIFIYDIEQSLNAMKYSYLINKDPFLINRIEYWSYSPYGFQGMIYSTIDLMYSPKIDKKRIRFIRELIWYVQNMVGIGNWISTWEREIKDNDLTSGVFVDALDSNVLTIDDLINRKKSVITKKIKRSRVERKLLKKWESNYNEIKKISRKIKTLNIKKFFSGLEKLLFLELISRHRK